jgi:hypothetical protein
MHTCKTCRNFVTDELIDKSFGTCLLMGDANDYDFYSDKTTLKPWTDRCYGWDYESYKAGTYVGENFGCIHWEKRV